MAKVLLIEDNWDIQENTAELLTLEGYDVEYALTGNDGVALAIKHLPHIILCDIQMPGLSGYEVFERLKKDLKTKDIPFVFVTASAEKKEMEAALHMGADGYVCKPFEPRELFATITQALQKINVYAGAPMF